MTLQLPRDYITVEGAASVVPTVPETIEISGNDVVVTLDGTEEAVLVMVSRDSNGVLTGVKSYNLTFANGRAEQKNLSLQNGDELYVWDSLSGMKPLAKKNCYGFAAD